MELADFVYLKLKGENMPNIEAIPDEMCLYNALDPYHVNFDNKPLQNIIASQ